ncbi:MAG TPA: flagellin [Lachnospiraceae bacterium]|nr:flagellin [Lachnospiraceae bacterium]
MKINYNVSALIAQNSLANSDNALSKSIERLSSGLKINSAKDDAAGLAISKKMNAQIRGLSTATKNAGDGISVIETAEGALAEIQDMLQRMNELTIKASNGTCTTVDRIAIDDEVTQLKEEITRISKDTEFNGQNLLAGTFDLKGYSGVPGINVSSYSDAVPTGQYTLNLSGVFPDSVSISLNAVLPGSAEEEFANNATITLEGSTIKIADQAGKEVLIKLDQSKITQVDGVTMIDDGSGSLNASLDITGIGSMNLQIGANEGQSLGMRIPEISLSKLGIDEKDCKTRENALKALDAMPDAISYISSVRSRLGSYQNRLEHSISSLDTTSENMTAAYSRIVDVDMATEMTEYTKNQVLVQAGTSMLAQANQRPEQVLQLLQ